MAESGIKEPGVMHPEFTDHSQIGGHFGRAVGGIVTASRLTRI